MRIMKVNDNTVRIFISFTELADMNLSLADFFQRTTRSEQFFWDLIAKAREEVDFHLDQPFWIQAMVASDDEFVVTVVKQEEQSESEFGQMLQQTINDRRAALRQSVKNAPHDEWVYAFEDLEDAVDAAAAMPLIPDAVSVLYNYEGDYYLAVSKVTPPRKRKNVETILDEYGEAMFFAEGFLREHAETVIADQAVSKLRMLRDAT
ncbi:MAG: adaptor protein MecA [Gracilibacteraceae bacterium]|jgi:adapter protein MecA 1/2|nr:adaptor protein MecA [Gracilibacteraceae bacterium]